MGGCLARLASCCCGEGRAPSPDDVSEAGTYTRTGVLSAPMLSALRRACLAAADAVRVDPEAALPSGASVSWANVSHWPCVPTRVIDGDTVIVQTMLPREAALLRGAVGPHTAEAAMEDLLRSVGMGTATVHTSVRLVGVDAPEISKAKRPVLEPDFRVWRARRDGGISTSCVSALEHQAGMCAKHVLEAHLGPESVWYLVGAPQLKVDTYGRLLADLSRAPPQEAGAAMPSSAHKAQTATQMLLAAKVVRAYSGKQSRGAWTEDELARIVKGRVQG